MNRFRNVLLRKCKSLSRSLSRSSSYRNLRSMSTRELATAGDVGGGGEAVSGGGAVVFVGSSRRRYVISNKHLSHPLIAALIDDDAAAAAAGAGAGDGKEGGGGGGGRVERRTTAATKPIAVNCEVVLFDHLLWMLDNAVDLRAGGDGNDHDAMRELAQLYAY